MSETIQSKYTEWLVFSDAVIEKVKGAIARDARQAHEQANSFGLPESPLKEMFDRLDSRDDVGRHLCHAVIQAIGLSMLREQRAEAHSTKIIGEGRFADPTKEALAADLPKELAADERFLAQVSGDVVRCAQKVGGHVDLGRGALVLHGANIDVVIKPVSARPSVMRSVARIMVPGQAPR